MRKLDGFDDDTERRFQRPDVCPSSTLILSTSRSQVLLLSEEMKEKSDYTQN